MKYQVEYYLCGCYRGNPERFKTKKEARKSMIEFIDGDPQLTRSYQRAGYKRIGSLPEDCIYYEHPVFGVDRLVRLSLLPSHLRN